MKKTSKIKKTIRIFVILIAVALFLVYVPTFVLVACTTGRVEYSEEQSKDNPLQVVYDAADFSIVSNDMYLTAEDGVSVFASEVSVLNPKGVIIFLAGMRNPSVTQFYPQAKYFSEYGYASILLEARGHGRSEGNIALGCCENRDVKAVVDYIKSKKEYADAPIIVCGVSMGGATAINSFGSIPEISALIAMSAYTSFEDITRAQLESYYFPLLGAAGKYSTRFWMGMFLGKEAAEICPEKMIANANGRKILLIASSEDKTVPAENTVRLAAACDGNADIEIWIRNSDNHLIIKDGNFLEFQKDTEYCEKMLDFLNGVAENYKFERR